MASRDLGLSPISSYLFVFLAGSRCLFSANCSTVRVLDPCSPTFPDLARDLPPFDLVMLEWHGQLFGQTGPDYRKEGYELAGTHQKLDAAAG